MNIKKITTAAVLFAGAGFIAMPALAQTVSATASGTVPGASVNAAANLRLEREANASSTRAAAQAAREERQQQAVANTQSRSENMIDQRISNLNSFLTRLQSMKNVSDDQKASFSSQIQAQVSELSDLKAKISTDTGTTSVREDAQSITKAYRIYALIEPQMSISAAADRAGAIATALSAVLVKIQSRLSANATVSADASVQAAVSDMSAKIADISVQTNAAVAEVSALKPDNGDKTLAASNLAALKDARSKIQAAQKDIVAARKDAQTVVKALMADIKSLSNEGTSTRQ